MPPPYRDGAPLKKQSDLGTDKAGYYKPDKYDIYFYNGESILAGELAPEGWKNSIGCRLGTAEKLHRQRCLHTKKQENGRQWYPVKLPPSTTIPGSMLSR